MESKSWNSSDDNQIDEEIDKIWANINTGFDSLTEFSQSQISRNLSPPIPNLWNNSEQKITYMSSEGCKEIPHKSDEMSGIDEKIDQQSQLEDLLKEGHVDSGNDSNSKSSQNLPSEPPSSENNCNTNNDNLVRTLDVMNSSSLTSSMLTSEKEEQDACSQEESLMTTQDLLAEHTTPSFPVITLEDSANISSDLSFIDANVKVTPEKSSTTEKMEVDLQLSPSQLTQLENEPDEIVPETPSKNSVSKEDPPNVIELPTYSLDPDINQDQNEEVVESIEDDVIQRTISEDKPLQIEDDLTEQNSVIEISVKENEKLQDGSDENKADAKLEVLELKDHVNDKSSPEEAKINDENHLSDVAMVETLPDLGSSVSGENLDSDYKQKSTDNSSIEISLKNQDTIKIISANSSTSSSPNDISISKYSPLVIFSQEDRRSAEIAQQNLHEQNASTPMESLLSSSSSFSESPSCSYQQNDCTVICKKIGHVEEVIKYQLKNKTVSNVERYLVISHTNEDVKKMKNIGYLKETIGQYCYMFSINLENSTVECKLHGFTIPISIKGDFNRTATVGSHINCDFLKKSIMKQSFYSNAKIICENVTEDQPSTFPTIKWNEIDSFQSRVEKLNAKSKKLKDGVKEIVGKKYSEQWRFYVKNKELVKVDRLLSQISDQVPSGYQADVSDSSLSKTSSSNSRLSDSKISVIKSPSSKDDSLFHRPQIMLRKKNSPNISQTSSDKSSSPEFTANQKSSVENAKSSLVKSPIIGESKFGHNDKKQWSKVSSEKSKPDEMKVKAYVFARFNLSYYPAVIENIEENGKFSVVFLEDGVRLSLTEKHIIPIERLPIGQSVMARSIDHCLDAGIIKDYYETRKDRGYFINRDDGLNAKFSIVDVSLTAGQAKILEEDLYGPSRCFSELASPISAELNLANVIHGKRRAAASCITPKSSRKNPEKNLTSKQSSSVSSDKELSHKRKCLRDGTYDAQMKGSVQSSSRKKLFDPSDKEVRSTRKRKAPDFIGGTGKELFKSLAFLLTNAISSLETDESEFDNFDNEDLKFDKSFLRNAIIQEGGELLSDFEEVKKSSRKCYLLASSHLRTVKYIQCVAANIVCLKHLFIHDSINKKRLMSEGRYILPSGYSIIEKSHISWHGKSDILSGMKIVVAGSRSFQELWHNVIASSGAEVLIARPRFIEAADLEKVNVVVADSSSSNKIINLACSEDINVVSNEWFIQSIIHGECLDYDAHPKFTLQLSSSSSDS